MCTHLLPFFIHSESFGKEAYDTREEGSICFKRERSIKQIEPSFFC